MRKSAPDRKVEISRTLLDLAFEVGPDQVTTSMIARRLGLTQPAIYKHFASKDEIWQSVAEYLSDCIEENLAEAASGDLPPDARIRLLVLGHLRLVRDHPALPEIMVMRSLTASHNALRTQMQSIMAKLRAALVANVNHAITDNIFDSNLQPNDASALILGIIQSLVLRMLLTRNPELLLLDAERLLDLLLSGFTPSQGRL